MVLFLVLAVVIYQVGQRSKQDVRVIGWANSLIWEAVGTRSSPIFEAAELVEGEAANTWTITGRLAHSTADEGLPTGDYLAEVERTCSAADERACWRLTRLSVDGRLYVTAGIVSLPQPDAEDQDVTDRGTPEPEASDQEASDGTPGETALAAVEGQASQNQEAGSPGSDSAPPSTAGGIAASTPSGLASLSALDRVQQTLDTGAAVDDRRLVDQDGRPVPPLPRRKPR